MHAPRHNDEQAHRYFEHGVHVDAATTINRPADELYAVWRSLRDLPRFIDHLARVEPLTETRSRWTAKGPADRPYTWEAEIIRDDPGHLIAWKTLPGSEVQSAGTVRFRPLPGDRGTEMHVTLEYIPTAGRVGDAIARALGVDARTQVREALSRFRRAMETGGAPAPSAADGPSARP
jgi:uncharacterized membrane protein